MRSEAKYLLSGATLPSTGVYACQSVDNFTVSLHSTVFIGTGSLAVTPSGVCNIDVLTDDSAPWITVFTNTFNNASGLITQLNGPFSQIRATLNPTNNNNSTTGTFSVICRSSSARD